MAARRRPGWIGRHGSAGRSEEHTSELQSRSDLVCRLLLEKKKKHTADADKRRHAGHDVQPDDRPGTLGEVQGKRVAGDIYDNTPGGPVQQIQSAHRLAQYT